MDPTWIILAMRIYKEARVGLKKNPPALSDRMKVITDRLQAIESQIDEQVLRDFRAGVLLLIDSLNTSDSQLKREQLLQARDRFATLEALDPVGITAGTSGNISNSYLICAGYLGSYYYFALSNDFKMAALKAYSCGRFNPFLALNLFDPQFFPDDLVEKHKEMFEQRSELAQLASRLGLKSTVATTLKADIDNLVNDYRQKTSKHQKKGGRHQLAAGGAAVIAGLVVGAIATPAAGMLAATASARAVMDSHNKNVPRIEFNFDDVYQLRRVLEQYEPAEQTFTAQVQTLCQKRLQELQIKSPGELKKLLAAAG